MPALVRPGDEALLYCLSGPRKTKIRQGLMVSPKNSAP